jgi:hypothetical protein
VYFCPKVLQDGTGGALRKGLMNEKCPIPGLSDAQCVSLKKKLRSMQWKPEAVMRETVLIQRLREEAMAGEI